MTALQREKLLHAVVFFAKNTRDCHKIKLFKLLHFFDFEIYRQTGTSPTGLRYFAFEMGPMPRDLYVEFKHPPPDMLRMFMVHIAPSDDPERDGPLNITPRVKFDPGCFTGRELDKMEELAFIYRDADADTMIMASHGKSHRHGFPWYQVYEVEGQHRALIPYRLILDGEPGAITGEQAEVIEQEDRELAALFR